VDQSDNILVEQFKAGREIAFIILYNRYKKGIYNFVLKLCGNSFTSEDITQETFLKVYQKIDSFKGNSAFSTWLFKIARNLIVDELRKEKRKEEHKKEMEPDRKENDDEMREIIKKGVLKLEDDLREVIILRGYYNLSYKEISEITGYKEQDVKYYLFKARTKLREIIKELEG